MALAGGAYPLLTFAEYRPLLILCAGWQTVTCRAWPDEAKRSPDGLPPWSRWLLSGTENGC